ncbi:hypothetical protein ACHAQJ_000197 [Trichoderma viride]
MDEAKLRIIEDNPIGNRLDAFRAQFASLCDSQGIVCSPDALDQLEQDHRQDVALDLLVALQGLRALRLLRSDSGDKYLVHDVSRLNTAILSEDVDLNRIKPLLKALLNDDNLDDVTFWRQVYKAFAEATPPRPPRWSSAASLPAAIATATTSVPDTPWVRNTSSILNSSEVRREVDPVLKKELGSPRVGIRKFRESFFACVPGLETTAAAVFNKCCEGDEPIFGQDGWDEWPAEAQEGDVLAWFGKIITKLEALAADHRPANLAFRRKLLAQPKTPLWGSTGKRSMDIGFVNDDFIYQPHMGKAGRYRWSHVLVPGELKSNPAADAPPIAWIDLATYAREVLSAQDTRRFVLAFTLCGSNLRLWEYDRVGGIASEQFDINEPKGGLEFVASVLGFLWIDEEGLGFDPTIMTVDGKRFIEIERHGKPERLIIDQVITRSRCISGRATTCWKAHREDDLQQTPFVIKDSWQYPERDDEGLLVQEATEKGVINVARYYHHETVHIRGAEDEVRSCIRKGLDMSAATVDMMDATAIQAMNSTTATVDVTDTAATTTTTTTSVMSAITAVARRRSIASLTSTSASTLSTSPIAAAVTRRRSIASPTSTSSTSATAVAPTSSIRRRHSAAPRGKRGKKMTRLVQLRGSNSNSGTSRGNSNSGDSGGSSGGGDGNSNGGSGAGIKRGLDEADVDAADVERPAKRSRSESTTKAGKTTNRIHRRIVLQDYGRPIYMASSPKALLAALENCIRGHESLREAGFLHRDISINNVVIDEDGPPDRKGFLIDLDLAIREQRIKGSGTKGKTGTRAFMAIGVLLGERHSFMHDLESFFWVLFWLCVHYNGPGKASKTEFDKWNYMDDNALAGSKMVEVFSSEQFCKRSEANFTAFYAPLIPLMDRLRAVVFPNGHPWKQADEGLYSALRETLLEGQE